jgi:hypothetical protein
MGSFGCMRYWEDVFSLHRLCYPTRLVDSRETSQILIASLQVSCFAFFFAEIQHQLKPCAESPVWMYPLSDKVQPELSPFWGCLADL